MAPQSPAPFGGPNRQSTHTQLTRYSDYPQASNPRLTSTTGLNEQYADYPPATRSGTLAMPSSDNLIAMQSPPLRSNRSPTGFAASRPASTFDFQRGAQGPDDLAITEAIRNCLNEVDLDNVTKKQGKAGQRFSNNEEHLLILLLVRALVEQRLQTELVGDRRAFLDRQIDQELANM